MNMLNQAEIKNLVNDQNSPCISIDFPTHPAAPEIRQDPIRHKNALSEAAEKLTAMGLQSGSLSTNRYSIYCKKSAAVG